MKKFVCLCLAALMLLSLCACGKKKQEPELVYVDEGPIEVTEQPVQDCVLLFSNACAKQDMTVYARLAAWAQEAEWSYLRGNVGLVDLGGSLRTDETERYDALDVMNRLGYDAALIGEQDLGVGVSAAVQAANAADFPLLCGDLIEKTTGDPVLDAWTMAWCGGRCIAYIGWCAAPNGTGFEMTDGETDYACTADAEMVQDAVDAARNAGAELVILLCGGGKTAAQTLLGQVMGVDVVVDGSGTDSDMLTDAEGVSVEFLGVEPGNVASLYLDAEDGSWELCSEALPENADGTMQDYLASLGYETEDAE